LISPRLSGDELTTKRKAAVRRHLWKVSTRFKVDADVCHGVYFVWANNGDEAKEIVAIYAHKMTFLEVEKYDKRAQGDS